VGTTSVAAPPITITNSNNGQTVDLQQNQELIVQLSSTFWKFSSPSDNSVIALESGPTTTPTSPCQPAGSGCGTVTTQYTAVSAGQSTISASRNLCGEDLGCNQTFLVTVNVSSLPSNLR
jgi:predicted secreted protein